LFLKQERKKQGTKRRQGKVEEITKKNSNLTLLLVSLSVVWNSVIVSLSPSFPPYGLRCNNCEENEENGASAQKGKTIAMIGFFHRYLEPTPDRHHQHRQQQQHYRKREEHRLKQKKNERRGGNEEKQE
jgi:hypothetical protein